MKHYFSFLLLSLSVFFSLVCPSHVMASTVLDFTWTTTDNNLPTNGSFSFSGKVDDAIKSWEDSWVGFGANVTATSRSTYPLTEGTYVFTLKLKWRNENKDNTEVPKIVINNGSDIECFHKDENLANNVETDLKYFVTVPSTGSYTIKVVSVTGERDKFGIRSLTIPSTPISCVYSVNNLIMKVITIDNVSTFELSHASNAITAVNNVNPINLHVGGVASGDAFSTSGWSIKDGKATKEITWTTLPTDNTITRVDFYAWIGSEIGGAFENFDISCTNGDEEPSCTEPSRVSVAPTSEAGNYGWRYTLGETIKLTATATGGTPSSYTYQWKKKTGPSTWKDLSDGVDATDGGTFSGTTSANLEISGCTSGNAGTYKCVVSTGAGCSTESNEFWVRVFTLNGNYSGSSFVENPIVWADEFNGTATVTLNANSVYEFKVTDNDTHTFGLASPDIYKDEDNFVIYGNDGNNVALHTGKATGKYTFTVNVYYANDKSNPYCTLTAVRYPKMTIYMSGGSTTWCDDNPVFFAHTYGRANNDVKMTKHSCEDIYYADVPSYNTNVVFTRQKPGSESIAWYGDSNFWNKSDEITIGSNNKFTCTGWNTTPEPDQGSFSGSTFSPSTYTISFDSNGSDGGSAMSDVTAIPCGESRTLVANIYKKSGYTFTGWKTNVAISTSAGDIPADGIVPNEATIQKITQNIILTAQWAEEEGCVSRYVIECEDNAYLITPTSATQSCPGAYIKGSDSGYWSGFNGQYIEHKNSAGNAGYTGEMYYLVNLPNTATYSFIVRTATNKNQWINIYGKSGSYNSNYVTYNNVTYKKIQEGVRAGVDNEDQKFKDVNTTTVALDAGTYVIGLYGADWATWDRFIIIDNTTYNVLYATGDQNGASINAINTETKAPIANNAAVPKCTNVTFTAGVKDGYRVDYWTVNDVRYPDADGLSSFSMDISQNVTVKFYTAAEVGELTISSLPWYGSQNLTEGTVVSAEAFNSCFDSEITFTFTGEGTVNYYYNDDRNTSLGTVQSGQAITLTNDLRARGIYIECTSGAATLTAVSKTTIGAVYEIWSAAKSSLGAVAVGDWKQQVVLGPEHFQTAIVGDVLRVYTSEEAGEAKGALQYIYTEGTTHTYKGLDNSTDGGLLDWTLSGEDKSRHYFEITIDATHLANLQYYGVIVKGKDYTIQSVELRASCANQTMRTTAPDITLYGKNESIDLMAQRLEFDDPGFTLGNWEHKLELDEKCFENVTVGSLINFYMQVQEGATLSFRCNVPSIEAESYKQDPPRCPSYGDISFDRTIDDLYGDEPKLIGNNNGYRVLYLLVDADMLSRLKETGMIICGKGTFIKAVEAVPNPFVINPGENKEVPTVVNNLEIYQGGEASNNDDIEVLGNITYFRPAKGGHLNNQLDTWYTFTLPFIVSDVEVRDEGDKNWYDINAVYYKNDGTDQDANNPDGAGHYYLQYLSKQEIATNREEFINRWKYITPGHSLACVSQYEENNGTRYGYPKKNEAYIILFDSEQPSELAGYWESNPEIRFVGGPQTIEGIAKTWKVPSDGNQYWMYANNTLHSFTLPSAYILNEEGTYFILQSNPTIRPFECYVQATESLKAKHAALPMRGFNIEDNTPTGAESIQGSAIRAEKILRNGQLIIIRNGVEYDATGVVIR